MDDPPGSRLFVVCGKTAEEEMLKSAFDPYGNVVNVKVIRDKGVAYVKFDKASNAADAMENLNGVVLNNGRGPKLKVLLAEPPNARKVPPQTQQQVETELACDPDNVPPRSRLFIVVPKTSDGQAIKEEMNKYPDMEYCKTDLIQTKGVVFCKYSKASSALKAMESVNETNILAGYRVKCMLAEPKSKRARVETLVPAFLPQVQSGHDFNMGAMHLSNGHSGAPPFSGFSGIGGVAPTGTVSSMNGVPINSLPGMANLSSKLGGALMLSMNNGSTLGTPSSGKIGRGMDSAFSPISAASIIDHPVFESPGGGGVSTIYGQGIYTATDITAPQNHIVPTLSKLRLFVVVHKGVSEEMLVRLFRRFPGMEYCDLKKDKKTNKSKGYCYVNYSTHEAAADAVQSLNGIEFPPHSSHCLKVMFAEPLGAKPSHDSSIGPIPISSTFSSVSDEIPPGEKPSLKDSIIEETENTDGTGSTAFIDGSSDEARVYITMSRSLPPWALEFVFSPFGSIEELTMDQEKNTGSVKFSSPESASRAITALENGYDILGQVLHVSGSP